MADVSLKVTMIDDDSSFKLKVTIMMDWSVWFFSLMLSSLLMSIWFNAIGPENSNPSYQIQISLGLFTSVQWKTDFSNGMTLKNPCKSHSDYITYSGFTCLLINLNWGLKVMILDFE